MAPAAGSATPRWLRELLVLAAALAVLGLYLFRGFVLDDCYITLRYARNLADGLGPVWNAGERVEGYTSFLLVVIAAALDRLGLDPEPVLRLLTFASAAAVVILSLRLARTDERVRESAVLAWLPPLALLPLQAFAYWATVPMEAMLFSALLLLALVLQAGELRDGRFRGSALAYLLLALTRPEGVLFFVLGWVFAALARTGIAAPRRAGAVGGRPLLRDAALFLVPGSVYFAWRWSYFGWPLPNTFYAKVPGGLWQALNGLRDVGGWAATQPVLALALLLAFAVAFRRRPEDDLLSLRHLVFVIAGYLAYVVLVGGDTMPYHRFFLPLAGPLAVLLPWAAARLPALRRRFDAPLLATALVLVGGGVSLWASPLPQVYGGSRLAVVGLRVGRWLRETRAPGDLVAVDTAGAVPFASRLPTLDMLGLSDEAIAHHPSYDTSFELGGHRRGWGEYVLERRPQIVLWTLSAGSWEARYRSDRELADDPRFRLLYRARERGLRYGPPGTEWSTPDRTFLGYPLGFDARGQTWARDLGLLARFGSRPVRYTSFFEGAILVRYFELDPRLSGLWRVGEPLPRDPAALVARLAPRLGAAPREAALHGCTAVWEAWHAGDGPNEDLGRRSAAVQTALANGPARFDCQALDLLGRGELYTALNEVVGRWLEAPSDPERQRDLTSVLAVAR